jgi:hypothetical protein
MSESSLTSGNTDRNPLTSFNPIARSASGQEWGIAELGEYKHRSAKGMHGKIPATKRKVTKSHDVVVKLPQKGFLERVSDKVDEWRFSDYKGEPDAINNKAQHTSPTYSDIHSDPKKAVKSLAKFKKTKGTTGGSTRKLKRKTKSNTHKRKSSHWHKRHPHKK